MLSLSVFTTITNPGKRGDPYKQALACYKDLADEVVVVNGGNQVTEHYGTKYVNYKWPEEFDWTFIGKQFQRGYKACTGDWVLHMDTDFLFHENDLSLIREALEQHNYSPAVSLLKRQFILPDRFNLKSRLVVAVNKGRFGDRIKFDSGGDLCQPSLDGHYIEPASVPDVKIPIWNYECILKTQGQLLEDKGRFARAWQRQFGGYKLGGPDNESAYDEWYKMVSGRFNKPQELVPFDNHPKYIKDTIRGLKRYNFGWNGFGLVKGGVYAQSDKRS